MLPSPLCVNPASQCWRGKNDAPIPKFKVQFRARPTDPAAVTARFGMTSGRTTQVTGPRPSEKAATKVRIAMTDRGWEGALRPIASRREEMDIAVAENRRMGFEPRR